MARKTTTETPAPGAAPTVEDVTAIGESASTAATETAAAGGTADESGAAAAEAARAEAERREIQLPQAVIDQIARASAAATTAELAQQGALSASEPPAADDQGADDDEDEPEGEPDPEPSPKTFADRFLSGYKR